MVLSISCYSTTQKRIETVAKWKERKVKIIKAIDKKSGEIIEFKKGKKITIVKGGIEWKQLRISREIISRENIGAIIWREHRPSILVTKDGRRIEFLYLKENKNNIIVSFPGTEYETIFLPFSEIKSVWTKDIDNFKTFFSAIGIAVGIVGVFFAIIGLVWATSSE